METVIYDVVILSDLHLGSEISRARDALDLLQSLRFHRLILLGDIFCDLNFRRLKKEHWRFLSCIRKLSNPKRNVDVVWVEGNHDYVLVDVMSHLVGVPVYQEFEWESAGERHLAIHGHQFDNFIIKNHLFMDGFAGSLYLSMQKLSTKGKLIARFLDTLNTRWQRLTPKVAKGALNYARSHGATRIFCGHTHEAIALTDNGVTYYNAGSWTNSPPSYITVLGRDVRLNEYVWQTHDYHAGEETAESATAACDVIVEEEIPVDVEYENIYG
jgi:UDP-2,3-diacylglucosamine pyrophosphatase LpxH